MVHPCETLSAHYRTGAPTFNSREDQLFKAYEIQKESIVQEDYPLLLWSRSEEQIYSPFMLSVAPDATPRRIAFVYFHWLPIEKRWMPEHATNRIQVHPDPETSAFPFPEEDKKNPLLIIRKKNVKGCTP